MRIVVETVPIWYNTQSYLPFFAFFNHLEYNLRTLNDSYIEIILNYFKNHKYISRGTYIAGNILEAYTIKQQKEF